jgi:hypothetical protein
MNSSQDMYYESVSSRSPGSQRHQSQTLHRQAARQFDAYGQLGQLNQLQSGLYTAEDHAARFEMPRYPDRLNATVNGNFGYEMSGAQGWNGSAFAQNNSLAALSATNRLKPSSRGRTALPSVRTLIIYTCWELRANACGYRPG